MRLKRVQAKNYNLFDIFSEVARKHPGKTAIFHIDDGKKWTFAELEAYANRVACYFSSVGVGKGDVVALFVENCPEHIGEFPIIVISFCVSENLSENVSTPL